MLFLRAFSALVAFDVLTALCPFESIYLIVKGWRVARAFSERDTTILRICAAVDYACAWYPKRALCLQRSFVTTYLLREHGIPAQIVLGAQKAPFKAHAWVE